MYLFVCFDVLWPSHLFPWPLLDIGFSLCKPRVRDQQCGEIFMVKAQLKTLTGKCEITTTSLGMESKAVRFHGTVGMMLRSKHDT